jgi:transposase
MDGIVQLSQSDRKGLQRLAREHDDARVRIRALIVMMLASSCTWSCIVSALGCSSRTVSRSKQRFLRGGLAELVGEPPGRRAAATPAWVATVLAWVLEKTPRDFSFLRSRWCCATLCVVLWTKQRVRVSAETVRRWLRRSDLVWRRPRPVIRLVDPERDAKLAGLQRLLRGLPADELAVFQDEVDINTNPKIGAMWMRRGDQAVVETPGDNAKRYLSGSLAWNLPLLVVTEADPGQGRNAELFVRHLDELRRRFGGSYRKIHVLCDNAKSHACRRVDGYLREHGDQVVLHYLPKRAPDTNPIERVWWHLHDEITRNHCCQTLDELLDLVFAWLKTKASLEVEGSVYPQPSDHQTSHRRAA